MNDFMLLTGGITSNVVSGKKAYTSSPKVTFKQILSFVVTRMAKCGGIMGLMEDHAVKGTGDKKATLIITQTIVNLSMLRMSVIGGGNFGCKGH